MQNRLPTFKSAYGLRAAMLSSSDPIRGLGLATGMKSINVLSLGDAGPDLKGLRAALFDAIRGFDFVCCHIGLPADASRRHDSGAKVESLEAIDREIIGPVFDALEEYGDPERDQRSRGWRLLIAPSHAVSVETGAPDAGPVPFLLAGSRVRGVVPRPFTEAGAADTDLVIADGHELMEYLLRGGLAGARSGRGR